MKAAAGLRAGFTGAVEAGPVAWGERFRERVDGLPAAAREGPPILHVPPEATTLGMCGVLRPVTGFEPVGPAKGDAVRR